jgi:hypothetical protein
MSPALRKPMTFLNRAAEAMFSNAVFYIKEEYFRVFSTVYPCLLCPARSQNS